MDPEFSGNESLGGRGQVGARRQLQAAASSAPTVSAVGTVTEYIREAMSRATFEDLEDEGWYGEIPGLQGVWGSGSTREACQQELQSALEDWILFGVANNFPIPPMDGVDVRVHRIA